jgi:two-component system response regulator AtoC
MRGKILVVDREESLHETLEPWLQGERYEVSRASSAEGALAEISRSSFEFVLSSYEMLDDRDAPLSALLVRRLPESTVLCLTPPGKEERARAILEWGVYDCVEKPVAQLELVMALRRAEERQLQRRENSVLQQDVQRLVGDRPLVAASPQMIDVLEATERVASERTPLLILGARGTGREILARAIHAQSDRRRAPFAVMPCRGASDTEIDARLFGHARDAAPGGARVQRGLLAEANGGTVYFDEISALPTSTQLRLVSLLADGEIRSLGDSVGRSVDLRVIAATSQRGVDGRPTDLHSELLALLQANEITVPALRERTHDIPLLVDHFFARAQTRQNKPLRAIADEVLERLVSHDWPGNLEELESVIHRAVMLSRGERVTLDDLPPEIVAPSSPTTEPAADYGLKRARKQVEAQLIRRALEATGGNRTHAAKRLEISHRALLYKLKEYAITD